MKHPRSTVLGALALAGLTSSMPVALAQSGAGKQPVHDKGQMSGAPDASRSMHAAMMKGMKDMQSMRMTGDIDRDFAMMMRMHHQQAIDMAREELRQGKDPDMKAMAQKMIDDQTKEVKQLDDWLAKHKR